MVIVLIDIIAHLPHEAKTISIANIPVANDKYKNIEQVNYYPYKSVHHYPYIGIKSRKQ